MEISAGTEGARAIQKLAQLPRTVSWWISWTSSTCSTVIPGSLALDLCPRRLWQQGQVFPRKLGLGRDLWLGAGGSARLAQKKRNRIKQNPVVLQQQIKGPPNKEAALGQRGEEAGKADDLWSKEGAAAAVLCPAGLSHGFRRCFGYPAGQGMKDQLCTGALLPGVTSSMGWGDTGTPALLLNPSTPGSTGAGGSHSLTWLQNPELSLPPCLSAPSFADLQR